MIESTNSVRQGLTKAVLVALLAIAIVALIGSVGAIAAQRRILYPLGYSHDGSAPFLPMGWKEVLTHHNGHDHRGYVALSDKRNAPVLIALHGNAADPFSMASTTAPWVRAGWTVIIPEYPGYAAAPGEPNEASMISSARASWDWAIDHGASPSRIVVLGNSIGSGPAIALAAAEKPALLIIVSGLTSMAETFRSHVPIIPDFVVFDRWENAKAIKAVKSPVAVWHGSKDTLVPFSQGLTLAKVARVPIRSADAGHELYWSMTLQDEMLTEATKATAAHVAQ